MDEFSFSITFTTGALVGAIMAVPTEPTSAFVVFTIFNALMSLLAYAVGSSLISFLRGIHR